MAYTTASDGARIDYEVHGRGAPGAGHMLRSDAVGIVRSAFLGFLAYVSDQQQ